MSVDGNNEIFIGMHINSLRKYHILFLLLLNSTVFKLLHDMHQS